MNHTNEPVPVVELPKKKSPVHIKNALIIIFGVAIAGLGGYMIYDKSNRGKNMQQQQTELTVATAEKSEVQSSFDASLFRLDSLAGVNTGLHAQLEEKNTEISKTKEEIRSILNNQKATRAELARAKSLVEKLNGKISELQ